MPFFHGMPRRVQLCFACAGAGVLRRRARAVWPGREQWVSGSVIAARSFRAGSVRRSAGYLTACYVCASGVAA